MAATPSRMLALGTSLPAFALPDVRTGGTLRSTDFRPRAGLLVMFVCNHCPYVVHVKDELARLGTEATARGLGVVAISANDVGSHPQDGPAEMATTARAWGWTFPYLYDETQAVARAFSAACTPDFFLFDRGGRLVYRGQLDDSRPKTTVPVTGRDLRAAIDAVLAGRAVDGRQVPSLGCNIKWRKGNEPVEQPVAKVL